MTEYVEKSGALTTDAATAAATYAPGAAPASSGSFAASVRALVPSDLAASVESLTNTAFDDVIGIAENAITSFVSAEAGPFAPVVATVLAAITPLLKTPLAALQSKVDALEQHVFGAPSQRTGHPG